MYTLILIRDVAGEYRFMVSNAVTQSAYRSEISVSYRSAFSDSEVGRSSWKAGAEMGLPKAAVLPFGENVLPKCEFEFSNNLPRCRVYLCASRKIYCRGIVKRALRPRQAADEAIVPWPVGAMYKLNGIGDSIAYRDFTNLQRDDQRGRQIEIPFIQGKRSVPIVSHRLKISCKTRC